MNSRRFSTVVNTLLRQVLLFGKHRWWVTLLLWIALINPALAEQLEIRVAIEKGISEIKVGSSTNAVVKNSAGQVLGEIAAMDGFVAQNQSGNIALSRWKSNQLWIEPQGEGLVWIGDRWYRGRTLLMPASNGLTAINYVDLEKYLYSVLGGEIPPSWPLEALKAQAVAARSYALFRREKTLNQPYDVGDTTTWQVYRGVEDEFLSTQKAVNETQGQVLVHGGKIIEAVFHSSSGGHTENSEHIWVQAVPYLRAVPDFDQGAPVYQWTETFTREQITSRIGGVGNIIALEPERKTPRGRIITMRVIGDAGQKTMSGEALRKALNLRSSLFEVLPAGSQGKNTAPTSFQFNGRGFGHGLGMSQYGAFGLSQQGYNYQQILQHFYQGTNFARIQVQ